MRNHPQPPGWGNSLSEPDFVSNQTGHLGINVETNPDQSADEYWRSNRQRNLHVFNPNYPTGE